MNKKKNTIYKKTLEKLSNMNLNFKFVFCIIVTIISFFGTSMFLNIAEQKENEYDYSNVYTLDGTVVDTYFKREYYSDVGYKSKAYLVIQLETGDVITIEDGTRIENSIGDKIVVYTNGRIYKKYKVAIAREEQKLFGYFLGACLFEVFAIVVWLLLFDRIGFWIGSILLLILYLIII